MAMWILFYMLLALVPAAIAGHKGRSAVAWLFVGLFSTPIVGTLVALLVRPVADGQNFRKCPYCAHVIRWESVACRFCGRALPITTLPVGTAETRENAPMELPGKRPNDDRWSRSSVFG
jgi:hypothetical protein